MTRRWLDLVVTVSTTLSFVLSMPAYSTTRSSLVVASAPAVTSATLGSGGQGFSAMSFASVRVGCAAGQSLIICTKDGGHSWHTSYRGGASLTQLEFATPSIGWAVGPSLLLATVDGGRTWQQRAVLPGLLAVDFVTPRDGWAVTMHGLSVTHTGGSSWASDPTPTRPRVVAFLNRTVGWMFGYNGTIFRTTTGGRAWVSQWTAPVGRDWTYGTAQLVVTSRSVGWLLLTLGQGCSSQEPYILYSTDVGGRYWQARLVDGAACGGPGYPPPGATEGPGGYPGTMSALGAQAWVAVASPASSAGDVAMTRDGGRTWSEATPFRTLGTGGLTAVDFVDMQQGWAITINEGRHPWGGRILHTADGGRTWVQQFVGRPGS